MEAITRIENILNEPNGHKSSAPEDSLAALEHFIDKMVTAENNLAKAAAQAAIKNRQIREEFERRVALISGQLHHAESLLAAFEESLSRAEMTPSESELLNSKRSAVVYWRSQLHQVCSPDLNNIVL